MTEPRVSIVLADAHVMFRDGLKLLVTREAGLVVVGEAGDASEALRLAGQLQPDLLLLDLAIPGGGLTLLRGLLTGPPVRPRPIVISAGGPPADLVEALQLGARGIVRKHSTAATLFKSVRSVMRGHYWMDDTDVADVVSALKLLLPAPDAAPRKPQPYRLTPRELEITSHIAGGAANKDIAQIFSIREDTVKHHLSSIFDKLGVFSRLELALFAIHHGLADECRVPTPNRWTARPSSSAAPPP